MDQSMYLPPPSSAAGFQHPPPQSANPTPASTNPSYFAAAPIAQTHPPYEQMIISAIEALKEKSGSSRQAIAKYIERVYTNLPPAHSAMLTSHLKRMKNAGVLVMDKYSYMLAGSEFSSLPNNVDTAAAPVAADTEAPPPFTLTTLLPVSEPVHTAAAVFDQAPDLNGPGQETATVVKRGRGRPPKVRLDTDGNGTVKKTAGRPRKPESQTMSLPKRRGRPRKYAESAVATLPSQRPVRRPKIGGAGRKYMKISGRPVGRPKIHKEQEPAIGPAEPKWMVDYMHVRVKLQHFQTRMQQAIGALKPHFSTESSSDLRVAAAFQELDQLSTIDIMAATFTDGGEHELGQESEQIHGDNQVPPPPAPPEQQQYYHGDEQVL